MEIKDQIKEKLDIVDIIGEYMQLKKAGANYRGLCPFHNEKSPSFMVSQDKQIFHCFGCAEGGDLITFVQKIENCDFVEALRLLSVKAGVTFVEFEPKHQTDKKAVTGEVNSLAARFYHQVLKISPQAQKARDYLKNRGLTELTIDQWQIGFSPEGWDNTLKALRSKKYNDQQIIEGGLAIRGQQGKVYDRFRNRIMFPIANQRGQVVGFTSRIIDPKDEEFGGKYVNSPQTESYNKSEVIFGLDKAKEAIKKEKFVVLVEGNMDVIMSHQAKVENVVATSGTALSAPHVKILKRFTDTFYFCFDSDNAGQQALLRAFNVAAPMEVNCFAITLSSSVGEKSVKDPDDLIRVAPEQWAVAISKRIPVIEYFIDKAMDTYDLSSDTGKKSALNYIFPILHGLQNDIQINHWLAEVAQKLSVKQSLVEEAYKKANSQIKTKHAITEVAKNKVPISNKEQKLAAMLYALLVLDREYLTWFVEMELVKKHPDLGFISDEQQRRLFKELLMYYNANDSFSYQGFLSSLENDSEISHLSNTLALSFEQGNLDSISVKRELSNIIYTLQELYGKKNLAELHARLLSAEKSGDKVAIGELMQEIARYNDLMSKHNV